MMLNYIVYLNLQRKIVINLIREALEEPEHKFPFVGDKFGYTSVTVHLWP